MTDGRHSDRACPTDAERSSAFQKDPTESAASSPGAPGETPPPKVQRVQIAPMDVSPEPNSHFGDEAVNPNRPGGSARWWLAVLVGLIVAMPYAWLLSYAGMLLLYLGLFFFVLFGVAIGAVVYRVASPGRPYKRWAVLAGTTIIVLTTWLVSLVKESRDFPRDVAIKAGNQARSIGDQTIQEFHTAVQDDVRRFLRETYPPGGTIGYARWILLSGELKTEQIAALRRPMEPPQRGYGWAIRVVLSIALLAYGVGSQTFLLRRAQDQRCDPEGASTAAESG